MIVGSKVDYDISNLYIPKDGKGDNDFQKSFNATLTIIVRDKEGNVIKRYKQKSHSPTSNFIGLMLPATYFNSVGHCWTMTTTSNSTFSCGGGCTSIGYPSNSDNTPSYLVGIMIGSGSNSNSYSAYNLNAPISNGTGTGQLLYSSPNIPTNITINGSQAYFLISQSYYNESSGTVNITELGIIVNISYGGGGQSSPTSAQILTWYDTLSSPISVGSGQQVVIYYTFSVNA